MSDKPVTPMNDDAAQRLVSAYAEAAEQEPYSKAAGMITDASLVRAYQRTDPRPGNAEAEALLAMIERRGLDV
jgi:hypothetical protein